MPEIPDAVGGAPITSAWGDAVKDALNTPDFGTGDIGVTRFGAGILELNTNGSAETVRLRILAAAGELAELLLLRTGDGEPRARLSFGKLELGDGTDIDVILERTAAGVLAITGAPRLVTAITPTTLGATANDYAPTGGRAAAVWRISASTGVTITGLGIGGADGETHLLVNVGTTNDITLADGHAGSSAANRFQNREALSVVLKPHGSTLVMYDGVTSKWRTLYV